jgi:hypothetical protein
MSTKKLHEPCVVAAAAALDLQQTTNKHALFVNRANDLVVRWI